MFMKQSFRPSFSPSISHSTWKMRNFKRKLLFYWNERTKFIQSGTGSPHAPRRSIGDLPMKQIYENSIWEIRSSNGLTLQSIRCCVVRFINRLFCPKFKQIDFANVNIWSSIWFIWSIGARRVCSRCRRFRYSILINFSVVPFGLSCSIVPSGPSIPFPFQQSSF